MTTPCTVGDDEEKTSSPSETCGEFLHDRFLFQKRAGKGTFGTAWVAFDRAKRQKVVVKILRKGTTSRAGFKRELRYARVAGEHPNVVKTWREGFETPESYLLVQELADAGDLFELIRPEVGMDEVRFALQKRSETRSCLGLFFFTSLLPILGFSSRCF